MKLLFRMSLSISALLLLVGCGTSVQPQLTETIPHQSSSLEEIVLLQDSTEECLASPAPTATGEQNPDDTLIHQEDLQTEVTAPTATAEHDPDDTPIHQEDLQTEVTAPTPSNTGTISTVEEYISENDSLTACIREKLVSTFNFYGDAASDAIDAMTAFLSTSEGRWMWDQCKTWNWDASYDTEQDYYILTCTGPMAEDSTRPVQSLSAKGLKIMGFPSGYISTPDTTSSAPEDPQISDSPTESEPPVPTEVSEDFPEGSTEDLDSDNS